MAQSELRTVNRSAWLVGVISVPWLGPLLVFACAGLAISLFALTPTTTRFAVAEIDGVAFGTFRTAGAGLVALLLLVAFRVRPPQTRSDWGLVLCSAFGIFIGFPLLFSVGSQITSASHAALIMAAMPLFTGLIGTALDRRLLGSEWFIGACIAMLGEAALVMMRDAGPLTQATMTGDLLVLLGCISCAAGSAFGARLTTHFNPWAATLWALVLASIGMAPFAALQARTTAWSTIHPLTWVALAHVTLGVNILAFAGWFWALARGGVERVAALQFAQPVLAVSFATLLLNEHLTWSLLAAGAMIVVGIGIACRSAPRPAGTDPRELEHAGSVHSAAPSPLLLFRRWRQARRARAEFVAMDYRDVKDLGFPALPEGEPERSHWRRTI